ncbi:hypothetical protein [Cryptosporangium phraense]|uniref:Uncharacterized protein n=1 Tax=Cryptosporangium phraense TaxID=2593070 RepID=A0A545AHN3_9ACTN|nr:hypothetical protein [Cryptosporangium phraense]TQS40821.1 hypothetical protein FL583_32560 [Cryptosporangium phraense]
MSGVTMVAFIRVPTEQANSLTRYEDLVLGLLPSHGALVERREKSPDGAMEAHLLSFPSREAIDALDADPRRAEARQGIDGSVVEALRFLVEPEDGPEDIVLWRFLTEEWFSILLESGQDLADVDLLLLGDVLLDVDRYVAAARRLAAETLIEAEDLASPEITFYAGQQWVLRFAEGAPSSEGVLVVFEGREPERLEELDADEV